MAEIFVLLGFLEIYCFFLSGLMLLDISVLSGLFSVFARALLLKE